MGHHEAPSHYRREHLQASAFPPTGVAHHPPPSRTLGWFWLPRRIDWIGDSRIAPGPAGRRCVRRSSHRPLLQSPADPRVGRPDHARRSRPRPLGRGASSRVFLHARATTSGSVRQFSVLSSQFSVPSSQLQALSPQTSAPRPPQNAYTTVEERPFQGRVIAHKPARALAPAVLDELRFPKSRIDKVQWPCCLSAPNPASQPVGLRLKTENRELRTAFGA